MPQKQKEQKPEKTGVKVEEGGAAVIHMEKYGFSLRVPSEYYKDLMEAEALLKKAEAEHGKMSDQYSGAIESRKRVWDEFYKWATGSLSDLRGLATYLVNEEEKESGKAEFTMTPAQLASREKKIADKLAGLESEFSAVLSKHLESEAKKAPGGKKGFKG